MCSVGLSTRVCLTIVGCNVPYDVVRQETKTYEPNCLHSHASIFNYNSISCLLSSSSGAMQLRAESTECSPGDSAQAPTAMLNNAPKPFGSI